MTQFDHEIINSYINSYIKSFEENVDNVLKIYQPEISVETCLVKQYLKLLWKFYGDNSVTFSINEMIKINPFEKSLDNLIKWCEKSFIRYVLSLAYINSRLIKSNSDETDYTNKFIDRIKYVARREKSICDVNIFFNDPENIQYFSFKNNEVCTAESFNIFRKIYENTDEFSTIKKAIESKYFPFLLSADDICENVFKTRKIKVKKSIVHMHVYAVSCYFKPVPVLDSDFESSDDESLF